MTTKHSAEAQSGRYLQGGASTLHKNRIGWWERFRLPRDPNTDLVVKVSPIHAGRPERIAYAYYKDVRLGWLIMQYNNIIDPLEELTTNTTITVPHPDRVAAVLLSSADTSESPENVQL